MKKFLCISVVLMLVFTLFACGGGETENTSNNSEISPEPETSTELSSGETSDELSDIGSDELSDIGSDETSDITSDETSDIVSEEISETSSEASYTEESSAEQSTADISKEESSEVSETSTETKVETPEIYGCTKLYDGAFVILGTCEENAVIYCTANGSTDSTESDHGYFSVRVKSSASSLGVVLWADVEGEGKSEKLNYTAKPKAVSAEEWNIIAGKNYQFHLDLTLNDYLHNNLYSQSQLDRLTQKLKDRQASLGDTEIIYVLVPSPATIYPETMPDEYVPEGSVSRLDQVMDAINKAGVKCIDVKALFNEHKNDKYKLYWKTDSHWSEYGAFLAYTELFDYISEKYPEAAPRAFDEFDWVEDYYVGGDMSYYLEYYHGVYSESLLMKEYSVLRVPKFELPTQISSINRYVSNKILTYDQNVMPAAQLIDTNRDVLPSAIVMRDSYSTQMYDILAEGFDLTYYEPMWSFTYNERDISRYKPDYLIYIIVERNLDSVFS